MQLLFCIISQRPFYAPSRNILMHFTNNHLVKLFSHGERIGT
nr:MAG TPA: hypothetical protein [Caudoviricetes sp.]